MNKSDAQKQIANLEAEVAKLKKIIDAPESGKNWRAERMGKYYFIRGDGLVDAQFEQGFDDNNYHYLTGNYFRTKEEAEAKKAYDMAVGKVTRRINELNGDYAALYVIYSTGIDRYDIAPVIHWWAQVIPKMSSQEIAEQIISECKEELDVIFKK